MPRLKPTDKRAALLQRRAELDAQLKSLEVRERNSARKEDTLRKIIAGTIALGFMEQNPADAFSRRLKELLEAGVAPRSRHLFSNLEDNRSIDEKAEKASG